MENKKPTGDKAVQGSRFLDPAASGKPKGAVPRKPRNAQAPRKPSGFSTAGQTPRRKPAPKAAEPVPEEKIKTGKKSRKARKADTRREPREKKPRRGLKLLLGLIIFLLVALAMIMIFGNRGTYHQMPIIERETEASFAPDQTPMPDTEGL